MSLSYEERKAIVEFRIEKAIRAYEQAKGVIPLMYWETIANRLYYAAYNAVSALLIANGDNAQTHAGVTHLFGMRFVNTGVCPKDDGRLYHKLFTMRQTGDYDDTYGLSDIDVLPLVEPAGEFIKKIVDMAKKKLQSQPDDNKDR
ncbi:MAG: HEPN domain-containing protein [Prevotella sp.]